MGLEIPKRDLDRTYWTGVLATDIWRISGKLINNNSIIELSITRIVSSLIHLLYTIKFDLPLIG